ncbi:MAG: alpha/beta hydrolase [Chloroflexota bacterium]
MNYIDTPQMLTQHTLLRDGCHLHYWLGGNEQRPLLVFMHGATMDHRRFNAQIEALLPHYRLLVWDARGHGRSQPLGTSFSLAICAQDMLAILDEIQESPVVLCGQSFGGYIAQHIYMLAPERVQAMIIIDSTPIAKAYSKLEVWALKVSLPLFRFWPYDHFVKTVATSTAKTPLVQEYALQAARQIERDNFLTIWQAVTLAIDDKGQPGLKLDVPLLLIHGDQDQTGTIKRDMPIWATWEKEATFHIIPNAGHNANQDNPEFTNRVILEFLQKYVP